MVNSLKQFKAVYYLEPHGTERRFNKIAIRPKFYDNNNSEKRCEWSDTARGAHFFFQQMDTDLSKIDAKKPPKTFKLIGKNQETLVFRLLTKEIFEQIKKEVYDSASIDSVSDENLQKHFLEHEFPYV